MPPDLARSVHSSLAYYGARYYDKTLIGWTQGDPLYRFAPDSAWTAPRRALLYSANLQNPLRYLDPDGYDVILVGTAHPKEIGLTQAEITKAAGRSGSFTTMSNTKKDARVISSAAQVTKALAGRSDSKVGYFGHASLTSRQLTPAGQNGGDVTAAEFAEAIKGMKKEPTDVYLYGCNSQANGFAEELAKLLPGVDVHGYAEDLEVAATAPIEKGKPNKKKAVLNPTNADKERTVRTEKKEQRKSAPADADRNGETSDQEMSNWMSAQQ